MNNDQFTHLDKEGNPSMVDVGGKAVTHRTATAQSLVILPKEVLDKLQSDKGLADTKKGPVFQTAILAGVMAAKRTSELIPLCHPLALDNCQVRIQLTEAREVLIECTVSTTGKTGVEMEALTGVSVAALTVYDMCKAFSHHIVIKETRLVEKTGGKRNFTLRKE